MQYIYIQMRLLFYRTSIYFYISILLNALLLVLLSVFDKYISFDSNKSKYLITGIFAVYVLCEIIYIIANPLKPFSDNLIVTEIALSDFRTGMEYLQRYPNNLPTVLLFNVIFRVAGYNVLSLKCGR